MDKKIRKRHLTLWGTARTPRIVSFATKTTPKFDNTIRSHAKKEKCMITEMLDKYQEAYIEKLEREKEQQEKQKITDLQNKNGENQEK